MMDPLTWLQDWYTRHCDGEWEHDEGIKIGTLDNPGWRITFGLAWTELAERPFERIERERSDDDWIHCWIKEHRFEGAGGQRNLTEMIEVFRAWAEPPV